MKTSAKIKIAYCAFVLFFIATISCLRIAGLEFGEVFNTIYRIFLIVNIFVLLVWQGIDYVNLTKENERLKLHLALRDREIESLKEKDNEL